MVTHNEQVSCGLRTHDAMIHVYYARRVVPAFRVYCRTREIADWVEAWYNRNAGPVPEVHAVNWAETLT